MALREPHFWYWTVSAVFASYIECLACVTLKRFGYAKCCLVAGTGTLTGKRSANVVERAYSPHSPSDVRNIRCWIFKYFCLYVSSEVQRCNRITSPLTIGDLGAKLTYFHFINLWDINGGWMYYEIVRRSCTNIWVKCLTSHIFVKKHLPWFAKSNGAISSCILCIQASFT